MAPNLKVIKISQVSPSTQLDDPFVLPLSFFDLQWLKLNHLEEVMFYKLTTQASSPDSFYSSIVPKLEQSLSLALTHFRPLTGHLKWEPQDPKPLHLVVFPQDTLSFKVAESDADFSRLSTKGLRPELELHALLPELPVFPNSAPVFSLQVTLFPNQGFCIGTTRHHVAMDGKSYANFIKSWAYICQYGTIPKDIPTLLDRTLINVPVELDQKTIELMPYILPGKENARNLKLPPIKATDEVVRTTLELTQETIEKLKERAREESTSSKLHLSTFVVTYAYVWTCMVKARGGPVDRPVQFMYAADYRQRLDPPVPETYFGNCVLGIDFYEYEAKTFLGEDGFIKGVHILSDSVKGLRSQGVESLWKVYEEGMKTMKPGTQLVVVTGSNQFGCYEADFGWGRPVHNEVLSIYQNDEFSMSKRRDHAGGVEIGISLKKSEMDVFMSLYENGLEKLSSKTSSGVQGGLAKEVHLKGSNLISLAS